MSKPIRSTLIIAMALVIGVAAGAYWRDSIARVFGAHPARNSEAQGLWTCGMHPQIIQDRPGECPICHMKLTPVRADSPTSAGGLSIDPVVVQNMGIRTAPVEDAPLRKTIRAVGTLEEAQTSIRDINLRVSGWIRKVHIASEGTLVEAGDPLFDLFSPELRTAVDELIAARRARESSAESQSAGSLYNAASRRLTLLGLDPAQVESLAKGDAAPESITFTSPIGGSVIEKPIVEGSAITAGQRALRIVDHSALWLEARVFEQDIPYIRIGSKAKAQFESRPRNTYDGEVTFIHPHVDPLTRAATVRMEIRNPGLALKPGMYATVSIESQVAERAVLAPREAVIDTGQGQVAVVALGGGKFEPRQVKTGLAGEDGMIQIVSGLAAGETVVTSGQFLLDSESRAREAIEKFRSGVGDTPPPGPRIEVTTDQGAKIDLAVGAYLAIAEALGAEQTDSKPINTDAVIEAARSLLAAAKGGPIERIASRVSATAQAMKGKTIDQQREAFKQLSRAMIALVDAAPPNAAVGRNLYLMNCPMTTAPGDWLQDTDDVANPYYATDMKSCGGPVRTIPPQGTR